MTSVEAANQEAMESDNPRDLPDGWTQAPLDVVLAELETGSRPKGGVRGITEGVLSIGGEHLNDLGELDLDRPRYVPEEFYETMTRGRIGPRDVLIVKDGATTGKVALVPEDFDRGPAAVNEHVFVLRFSGALLPEFAFYFLYSPEGQRRILANFRGSAQGGINRGFAPGTLVPIAPLDEQRRIVTKLNLLRKRLEAVRGRIDTAATTLRNLHDSAVSMALAGDRAGSDGWSRVALGSLLKSIDAGKNVKCQERPPGTGEYGIVKISAVTWGEFDEDASKTLPSEQAFDESKRINKGDLLISRANTIDLVGAAVRVRSKPERNLMLSDKVLRLNLMDDSLADWVLMVLQSRIGRDQIEALATGNQVSMRNISQKRLRTIEIPLPPDHTRVEVSRQMTALSERSAEMERNLRSADAASQQLERSVLETAFRGELVPTESSLALRANRSYESGDELLEKVGTAN